jgi:hypothetical protein
LADTVNFVHRFTGNHDKPRILHLLAMNQAEFATDKTKAMASVLHKAFDSSNEFHKLDPEYQASVREAIDTLANGTYSRNKIEYDNENFGVKSFDLNTNDVIAQAKDVNRSFWGFADNPVNKPMINKIKAEVLRSILTPAMEKYRAIMLLMVALPGNPTNYAGDEFGETGWETGCKNEHQQDRGALHWNWLNDPEYTFVKEYRERIAAIMKIRNNPNASALVNGSLISLESQPIKGGGHAGAFYRYNDRTDAIAVLHNKGYSENGIGKEEFIEKITLNGLPNGLQPGAVYVNALNHDDKYKVTGPRQIEKLDYNGNRMDINISNAGLILLRETPFNQKPYRVSHKGRIENPNVKLANTKFDFGYMNKAFTTL